MRNLWRRIAQVPVIDTLLHLTGNGRACLWTEPLWGIPYNLYMPFVAVYMAALGLSPTQIGIVSTVYFASQVVWSLLSGVLTDKLGRRKCTLIYDTLSWTVPTLLWMAAQDFSWFVVAAVFNGANRVTENSWNLLMAEEAPPDKLVHMYSITHIAGVISSFIAPLTYIFVQRYSVVPTMRVLYGITCVMMTAKFIILYVYSHETPIGLRRMADTKHMSLLRYLGDSPKILLQMLRQPRVMLTVGFIACLSAVRNVLDNFWPLLVTDKLGISAENLSIFSTVKSLLMLLAYFTVVPKLRPTGFRFPLLGSVALLLATQVLLVFLPEGAFVLVTIGALAEAFALSILSPLSATIQMVNTEKEQRARINGWLYALCLGVTSPFGVIAGVLSEMNRIYPFFLTIVLLLICLEICRRLADINDREGILE